jgi:hypothetical protein
MAVFDDFGLAKFGQVEEAAEWSTQLGKIISHIAPEFDTEEREELPLWIGTGVAAANNTDERGGHDWVAAAIVETREALKDHRLQRFWDRLYRAQVPFAVLEVGPIDLASVTFGGSVGVLGKGGGGTLGGAVSDDHGCLALTAGHVVSPGQAGSVVEQPAASDGHPRVEIGHVVGFSNLWPRHNTADVGLIRIDPDHDTGERALLVTPSMDDLAKSTVHKTGKATSTTSGVVTRVAAEGIGIRYMFRRKFFDGLFAVESSEGRFAWHGDSGALVIDNGGGAVGMVIAVSAGGGTNDQPLAWAVPTASTLSAMRDLLS